MYLIDQDKNGNFICRIRLPPNQTPTDEFSLVEKKNRRSKEIFFNDEKVLSHLLIVSEKFDEDRLFFLSRETFIM